MEARCGWANVSNPLLPSACVYALFPGQWNRASEDFFESFRNYDEAGSPQRIQVLKYLVLANMLTGSEVNPFDSQETKPYKNDSQIKAMTDLVDAYQRREVHLAEKILRGMSFLSRGDLLSYSS